MRFVKGHKPWNTGTNGLHQHSVATLAKMSLTRKGRPKSDAHKIALSNAQKGRRLTLAHRQKLRIAKLGTTIPTATRARMSIAQKLIGNRPPCLTGSSSPTWKGGLTTKSKQIRNSAAYATWRSHVFNRDDYTCQGCGQRGGELQADHELPFSQYPDLRFEILNGRTLCVPCHKRTPTFGYRSRTHTS